MKTKKAVSLVVSEDGVHFCVAADGRMFICRRTTKDSLYYIKSEVDGSVVRSIDLDRIALGAPSAKVYTLSGEGEQGTWAQSSAKTWKEAEKELKKALKDQRWLYHYFVTSETDDYIRLADCIMGRCIDLQKKGTSL